MKWASAFSYLPINYGVPLENVEHQTQRVIFDNNLNGNKIRLRLSNRYSRKTLILTRVSVGRVRNGHICDAALLHRNGNPVIELKPGEECWSDELEYSAVAGERLAVSTYIKEQQEIGSICTIASKIGPMVFRCEAGTEVSGGVLADCSIEEACRAAKEDTEEDFVFYGFTGLQVLTEERVKIVAAFGDSITHMSYVTNAFYKRIYAAYPGLVTVLNRGIGGNRVLHDATVLPDGGGVNFGIAGIKRFEEDVFKEGTVDVVLVLEGINDIMHPIQFAHPDERITADELTAGFQQYIDTAHEHHARIFGATITPCGHEDYPDEWISAFEEVRVNTNEWIRGGNGYDGYFDYDAAVRDESRPAYMKEEYHLGDGLHPNDAGGAAIAEQIDLAEIMK